MQWNWGRRCLSIGIANHPKPSRGRLLEEFYSDDVALVDSIELAPCSAVVGLNIPIDQWHAVRALESGTVIMEVKDGPYEPTGPEDILEL